MTSLAKRTAEILVEGLSGGKTCGFLAIAKGPLESAIAGAIDAAVEEEREACVNVVLEHGSNGYWTSNWALAYATAIRARSSPADTPPATTEPR